MSEHEDPFERFGEVFARAEREETAEPNAMVISSVDAEGRPSSRVVLLKGFDSQGFVFYTNLESRKGTEITANPNVALNFFWRAVDQQVGIFGRAERVSDAEADDYFATRPRGSQLGAWASLQSRPLPGRAKLLADVAKLEAKHLGRTISRPPHWSGFRVVPQRFEFWVRGAFRLHDRTVYERSEDGWRWFKVYP